VIVECPRCESKVDAEERGAVDFDFEIHGFPGKAVLLECPVCHDPLFGFTELIETGFGGSQWAVVDRKWPVPDNEIDYAIPEIAKLALVEAKLCFKARAYNACAVMCGRTIEGVCKHHNSSIKTLASGLKKLNENGVIDNRIYQWGEALRKHRNLGAHATTEQISKEDAKDLLDFSIAICDYVFVLNEKFKRFQERQQKA
jgi:hypothetical protein